MDYAIVIIGIIIGIIILAVSSFLIAAGYKEVEQHVHGTKGLKKFDLGGKELLIGLGIVLSLVFLTDKCS